MAKQSDKFYLTLHNVDRSEHQGATVYGSSESAIIQALRFAGIVKYKGKILPKIEPANEASRIREPVPA